MPAVSMKRNSPCGVLADRVDRVTRRARHLADDRARLADDGVEERRLAGVRPPDDDDRHRRRLGSSSAVGSPVAGGSSADQLVEQVAGAQAVHGADGPRVAQAELVELGRRLAGGPGRRSCWPPARPAPEPAHDTRRSPKSSASGPARPSTTKTTTSAPATAALICSRMSTANGASAEVSKPPVSTSVKRRPFHSASISLRSRVTPGVSCTTA